MKWVIPMPPINEWTGWSRATTSPYDSVHSGRQYPRKAVVIYSDRSPEIMEIPMKKYIVSENEKHGKESIQISFTNRLEAEVCIINKEGTRTGGWVLLERNQVAALIDDLNAVLEQMPTD